MLTKFSYNELFACITCKTHNDKTNHTNYKRSKRQVIVFWFKIRSEKREKFIDNRQRTEGAHSSKRNTSICNNACKTKFFRGKNLWCQDKKINTADCKANNHYKG